MPCVSVNKTVVDFFSPMFDIAPLTSSKPNDGGMQTAVICMFSS